jgi:hypothetical protein
MTHLVGGLLDFLSHLWIIYVGIGLLDVTVIVAAVVVTSTAGTPTWLLDNNNLWLRLHNNSRLLLRIVLWEVLRLHDDLWLLLRHIDRAGMSAPTTVPMSMYVLPQQGARNACQCALFALAPCVSLSNCAEE